MTMRLILALLLGFVVAVLMGKVYVPWLRKMHAGQEIREDGPTWHMSKAGTPTMGGIIFILGVTAAVLLAGFSYIQSGDMAAVIVLVFSLAYGAVGFVDDFQKLRKKQNMGLTGWQKLALQLVMAVALLWLLRAAGYLTAALYVPFFNVTVIIPAWCYYVLAVFIIVGTVNAVNLTDGVDGLAASVSLPVFVFYTTVCFMWSAAWSGLYGSLAVFSAGMTGALFGFLVYNFHPAKCFMGDTGSLFLGGAVCGMAFALDMPLILVTLGIIFILEALSDIIQVGYFKLTHGKRVFKMAPFHHHLEMGGWLGHKWTEVQIVALFTGVTLLFAVLSFAGCVNRPL